MIRPLAPFALLSLVACAPAVPPAASPEPSPAAAFTLAPPHEQTPADGEMVAIGRAEAEIDRLFPEASAPDTAPRKAAKPAPLPPAADADGQLDRSGEKKEDRPGSPGPASASDRCAVACKALSSMATSADHLCKLAGESDGRCDDARARVRGASARVRSACPGCAQKAPASSLPVP
jgi:hypothetical protein